MSGVKLSAGTRNLSRQARGEAVEFRPAAMMLYPSISASKSSQVAATIPIARMWSPTFGSDATSNAIGPFDGSVFTGSSFDKEVDDGNGYGDCRADKRDLRDSVCSVGVLVRPGEPRQRRLRQPLALPTPRLWHSERCPSALIRRPRCDEIPLPRAPERVCEAIPPPAALSSRRNAQVRYPHVLGPHLCARILAVGGRLLVHVDHRRMLR